MMEQAAKNSMSVSFSPEEIMGSEITKSGDYKYARVGIKRGDNEFMTISYEWKGESVPEFVMGLMDWMKANKEEVEKSKTEKAAEYAALKERK